MPVEDDGLTDEERALFDDLVDRIERNRDTVLSVLDGNAPSVSCSIDEAEDRASEDAATSAAPSPEVAAGSGSDPGSGSDSDPGPGSESDADPNPQPPDGVSAADLMGGSADAGNGAGSDAEAGAETRAADPSPEPPATEAPPSEPERETTPAPNGAAAASAAEDESPSSSTTDPDASQIPGVPRTTVRITADVGEIVGADDRDYDLGTEDVVTLPEPNADVLVEKDAAERL
jgi:DNA replication factor GINS